MWKRFGVNRQKPLRLPERFEPLHDPFASSCLLMRILCPVVQPLGLAVFNVKDHGHSTWPPLTPWTFLDSLS